MSRSSSMGRGLHRTHPRRRLRALIVGALAGALTTTAAGGEELKGQPPLAVVSFGGVLERSQMRAVIRPYRKQSGHWVTVLQHEGGVDEIAAQVRSENVRWDVVNLDLPDMLRGCRAGLLEKIDASSLPKGSDGKPAREDFYPAALHECGVGHNIYATVAAYDTEVFATPPTKIADFFDTGRFPGLRGLRRDPQVALEWALLADGVAQADLYATLDTEKGIERAFSVLDRIRDDIVWWTGGDEGPGLIDRGLVTMGSAWNGRVHSAVEDGASIGIVWDAHVLSVDVWSVPRGSDRLDEALRFIRFATGSEVLARQAREIPYGPARRSGLALVASETQSQLPTAPGRLERGIRIDYEWWAANGAELEERFEDWIAQRPVYDFHKPDRN